MVAAALGRGSAGGGDQKAMTEYRCKYCNMLLFKGRRTPPDIEIKCTRGTCRLMNVFGSFDREPVLA